MQQIINFWCLPSRQSVWCKGRETNTAHVGPSRQDLGLVSHCLPLVWEEKSCKREKKSLTVKLALESPNGTCTSPSHRHRPHNTHLGTLSRLPTQTCWGGTIFHFLASTTIASASTSPKPYRWLTGKREDSETLSLPSRDQELLLSAWWSILQPSGKVWS